MVSLAAESKSNLPAAQAAGTDASGRSASQRVLMLQAGVLSQAGFAPAATAFATALASEFGCSRVSFGFVRRRQVEVAAMSHGQGGPLVGEMVDTLAGLMDEAVQQGASVQLPVLPGARSLIRIAHAKLLQRQGGAIVSVPLMHRGAAVGAVCCEWPGLPSGFEAQVRKIETIVNLVGPVLHLMRLNDAPLHERAASALRRAWRRTRARDRRVQLALAGLAVLLGAACVVPLPYRVGGHARIEGAEQRSLVAPTDGFLKMAHVRPGDRFTQGQVLVEMADQDLVLQRRKWASELGQQESAHAVALGRADRAAMVIALARAEQARAQLAQVDADIARASVVAPFDGVVIQGDLAQAVGSPLERGKPLLLVAPGEAFRVIVGIDERDVAELQPGQPGQLALSALPWDTLPLRVVRVTPIARSVDGNNVFEVEAELAVGAVAAAGVRPGLEGVAKITVAERPLVWAWGHRTAEWLRLKAWAWWA